MRKLSRFSPIIILAALACVVTFTQGGQPLAQAQAVGPASLIPNVVGNWSVQISEAGFHDPSDPSEGPHWSSSSSSGQPVIHITEQRGHVFAGYISTVPDQHDKITGAVIEDGTITIQDVTVYGQSTPNRALLSGNVSPLRNPTRITLIGHGFEEYGSTSTPSYTSMYIQARKVR
jgi:hypothetical protein